jgi:hypothetical protein
MEAARTSETSVDNHFTRQYNPEDSSEQIQAVFGVQAPMCLRLSSAMATATERFVDMGQKLPLRLSCPIPGRDLSFQCECFLSSSQDSYWKDNFYILSKIAWQCPVPQCKPALNLWGHLKAKVFAVNAGNIEHPTERTVTPSSEITPQTIHDVLLTSHKNFACLCQVNGTHITPSVETPILLRVPGFMGHLAGCKMWPSGLTHWRVIPFTVSWHYQIRCLSLFPRWSASFLLLYFLYLFLSF